MQQKPGNHEQPFTKEQKDLVDRIRKCKSYYEVLDVSRDANEDVLKRQYKKLALSVHPDKNRAPAAEDAFKRVGQAFACLSNEEKRRIYDMRGGTDEANDSAPGAQTRYRTRYTGGMNFGDEFDADDLFSAMFFGNGGGFRGTTYSYTPGRGWQTTGGRGGLRRPHQQPTWHQATGGGAGEPPQNTLFSLFQFLPLILLLLFTVIGNQSNSEPIYQFSQTAKYPVERHTYNNDISYWVPHDFGTKYNTKDRSLMTEFEDSVEISYIQQMRTECFYEQNNKQKLVNTANYYAGSDYGYKLAERVKAYSMPSCDFLTSKRIPVR